MESNDEHGGFPAASQLHDDAHFCDDEPQSTNAHLPVDVADTPDLSPQLRILSIGHGPTAKIDKYVLPTPDVGSSCQLQLGQTIRAKRDQTTRKGHASIRNKMIKKMNGLVRHARSSLRGRPSTRPRGGGWSVRCIRALLGITGHGGNSVGLVLHTPVFHLSPQGGFCERCACECVLRRRGGKGLWWARVTHTCVTLEPTMGMLPLAPRATGDWCCSRSA